MNFNKEWQKKQLSNFIKINPMEKVKKGSILKKVSMADIQPYHRKIENYIISKYSSGSKFRNGDTLMARITPCLENGKTAFVDILDTKEIAYGSTEFIVLRNIQDESINKYVYYFTISPKFKNIAIKSMTGTSGRQRVQADILKNLVFFVPEIEEQEEIVSILSSLDDKTELNNQINKNLEQIAQAIFKQWFIEFEFPDENGEPYKSSGGEMVDSELGPIPKGWGVKELKSICDIQNGFAFKSKDYTKKGIKVIRTLNINNCGFVENNNLKYLPKEFYNNKKYYKCKLEKFDTLLVMVGASLGKLGMVTSQNLSSLQNQNMWRFRPNRINISSPFIYYTVKRCNKLAIGWATGSAREFYRKDIFGKIKCVLPKNKELGKFNILSIKIFNKIENNLFQNQILSETLNVLLPKLVSGEIRMSINNKEGDE